MNAPGESARVKVTAIYGDGGTRDVTGLAVVESNVPDVATVADADGERRAHRRGHAAGALSGQRSRPCP